MARPRRALVVTRYEERRTIIGPGLGFDHKCTFHFVNFPFVCGMFSKCRILHYVLQIYNAVDVRFPKKKSLSKKMYAETHNWSSFDEWVYQH